MSTKVAATSEASAAARPTLVRGAICSSHRYSASAAATSVARLVATAAALLLIAQPEACYATPLVASAGAEAPARHHSRKSQERSSSVADAAAAMVALAAFADRAREPALSFADKRKDVSAATAATDTLEFRKSSDGGDGVEPAQPATSTPAHVQESQADCPLSAALRAALRRSRRLRKDKRHILNSLVWEILSKVTKPPPPSRRPPGERRYGYLRVVDF